ncbi:MAG: molybdate ABC transporter substrate-binding protein [Peptostreptococcaceae bacterium]
MKMKLKVFKTLILASAISLSLVGCGNQKNTEKEIELNISAAASLKEAMVELEAEYKKENENIKLVVNFGASGSLQRQIEQGAPCDIFISAGTKQMTSLEEDGLLLNGSNKNLVENDLVLVISKGSEISSIDDLKSDKVKHIAVGEPESVPAGKYADEVLTNLNLKEYIKDKLVFAKDVKEVLAWTASENTEVGFVYYSDALMNDSVNVVLTTPIDSHSPIVYPVAIIKNSKKIEEAQKFEDFLFTDKAQEILQKYGYKSAK